MKPLLRLISGGKKPKMKFASFGRDRDLDMIERYISDPIVRSRQLDQTVAAHDLSDGSRSVDEFIAATRRAVFDATQAHRDAPLILLARIANYHPDCLKIWDELAASSLAKDRFTVACRLYGAVPVALSDRLFNSLRHDRSKRVRDIAIDRYENRADEKGAIVFDVFDANLFDDRVRRGEVKI